MNTAKYKEILRLRDIVERFELRIAEFQSKNFSYATKDYSMNEKKISELLRKKFQIENKIDKLTEEYYVSVKNNSPDEQNLTITNETCKTNNFVLIKQENEIQGKFEPYIKKLFGLNIEVYEKEKFGYTVLLDGILQYIPERIVKEELCER